MIAWTTILYGILLAINDAAMLGLIKDIYINGSLFRMVAPTILYAIQPWIFLSAMKFESMAVMNITWDLISDVLVSLIGIFYFKEILNPVQICGLILGFISLIMMGYKYK